MNRGLDLSVVIPLFNEEANVEPVVAELLTALEAGLACEVLLVDDGSSDGTLARASDCARRDSRIRVLKLRRNYGQTAAMAAGIAHSRGRILVTMDGDQQNDPADIPRLLAQLDRGYDVVVGWRRARRDHWLTRRVPSMAANRLIGLITGIPIHDNGCTLKAFRAAVIREIPLYAEMHRFIPAMASVTGARIGEIEVNHRPRRRGVSKYGLARTYRVLLDLVTVHLISGFAVRPLLWFALLALPMSGLGFGLLVLQAIDISLYDRSLSLPIAGSGVLFLSCALILVMSGVLAELAYRLGDARAERLARITVSADRCVAAGGARG
jgi:glycosyltransferase involved in cell wall biosynthesis